MSTNPFYAGNFYSGSFVREPFIAGFSRLLLDERLAILVSISPKPDVSVLIMTHDSSVFPDLGNLGNVYGFYTVAPDGSLETTIHLPSIPGRTNALIAGVPAPSVLVMTDENGDFRYVTAHPTTLELTVSTTNPYVAPRMYQFVGEYLEMIGQDGQTTYRMSVSAFSDHMVITPSKVEGERLQTIYISNGHHDPFDGQNFWAPGLLSLGDVDSRIEQTETGFGGVSVPRVSALKIQLMDRRFDFLTTQSWDTRHIQVLAGLTSVPIGQYQVILRAESERAEWNQDEFTISLRDQSVLFERSIQTRTYQGTGGFEGPAEITGNLKPLAYGFVREATPVLVDSITNLYQVHDGPIHSYTSVAQGAVPLTLQPTGLVSLLNWLPTPADVNAGICRTDISNGMFKLAAPPGGAVTATFMGSTSVPVSGAKSQIIRAIAQKCVPEARIDNNAFTYHTAFNGGLYSFYTTQNTTVLQAFRDILGPSGDFVHLDRLNVLKIKHIERDEATAFFSDNNVLDLGLNRREPPRPGAKYRGGYNKSWTVLNDKDFLGAANPYIKQFTSNEFRWNEFEVSNPNSTTQDRYESAKTVDLTFLSDGPSADILIQTVLRDYSWRHLYEITTMGFSWQLEIGDTVLLQLDRWGMNVPQTMIIVGLTELSPTFQNEDQTKLLLLG